MVTSSNKKPTSFLIRCASSGLYLEALAPRFDSVTITPVPDLGLQFEGADANHAVRIMRGLYPSFDWRAVETAYHIEAAATVARALGVRG